jgi:CBS domain containing-hemolysin-like protein
MTPPWFIPESTILFDQLQTFRARHEHFAIVVDEYGGTSGICTIEDVIEEIVGEIHDEHEPQDELPPEMVKVDGSRFEADGRMNIAEINERLGISLPEGGDFDTIAGFLLDRFGRVPVKGERDEIPEAMFEILAASPTKIDRVAIVLREEISGGAAPEDASSGDAVH